MSKSTGWTRGNIVTQYASKIEHKKIHPNPITLIENQNGLITYHTHDGTGITYQYLDIIDVDEMNPDSTLELYQINFLNNDEVITELAYWGGKLIVVSGAGLNWQQKFDTGWLSLLDDHIDPRDQGDITTELLSIGEDNYLQVNSANTAYSTQKVILNANGEDCNRLVKEGYSISMVRGFGDKLYTFFIK
ncbi:MAG: hypothetical protein V2I47_05210 [Bacteroidales bacterium]|jgi:hypothetical protein|nr:hypothetical protein [Bacteroidales bacterium]